MGKIKREWSDYQVLHEFYEWLIKNRTKFISCENYIFVPSKSIREISELGAIDEACRRTKKTYGTGNSTDEDIIDDSLAMRSPHPPENTRPINIVRLREMCVKLKPTRPQASWVQITTLALQMVTLMLIFIRGCGK